MSTCGCGEPRLSFSVYCEAHQYLHTKVAAARASRVWRPLDDTAARIAAPVWALVWLLSLGRMGQPMYRRGRVTRGPA